MLKNTVGSVDKAKQLSWLLADVVGGMVDCLLVRAKFEAILFSHLGIRHD